MLADSLAPLRAVLLADCLDWTSVHYWAGSWGKSMELVLVGPMDSQLELIQVVVLDNWSVDE